MAVGSDRTRKQKITIQNGLVSGSGSHTNFPILITLDHLDSEIVDAGSDSAQNGGGDLQFSSDSSGADQLSLEVAEFVTNATPASRTCELYVLIPSLSTSADTDIWVWYNTPTTSTQPAVAAAFGRDSVWAGFERYYHLNEAANTTAGGYTDSSGNNDGTGINTITDAAAQFGQGLQTPGGLTTVGSVNTGYLQADGISMGFWVAFDLVVTAANQLIGTEDGTNKRFFAGLSAAANWSCGVGGSTNASVASGLSNGQWVRVWLVADSGTARLYADGVEVDSFAYTFSGTSATPITINSHRVSGNTTQIDGITDNFALTTAVPSADWIATEFNNQNAPETFAIVNSPEMAVVTMGTLGTIKINPNDTAKAFFISAGYPIGYNDGYVAFLRDFLGVLSGGFNDLYARYAKVGGVFPPFIPSDVADGILWLDSTKPTTIPNASGVVSQWNDKLSTGNDAIQATEALRPTTGASTLNGRNVIDFDVTNTEFLRITDDASLTSLNYTVFMALSIIPDVAADGIMGGLVAGGLNIRASAGELVFCGIGGGATFVTSTSTLSASPSVISITTGTAGSELWFNGTSEDTDLTDPLYTAPLRDIGKSGGPEFNGSLGEVIVYDRILTDTERVNIETYLIEKWIP